MSLGKKISSLVVEDVTIVACSSTLLLYATQESLNLFLSKNTCLQAPIAMITNSMISDKLAKIPFLYHVKDTQLTVLAAMCRYEVIDSSKVVFEEGSSGSKLYIVLDGEVSVHADNGEAPSNAGKKSKATALRRSLELQSDMYDEASTCVAKLGPGDYFGETSLLVNIPRTLTVLTTKKSLFLTVDKVDFENFLKVCSVKESIDELMKNRMIQMLSTLGIPFFVDISTDKFKTIIKSLEIHEVDENSVIFKEGDIGDRFYIIFYGEVSIEANAIVADINNSSNSSASIGDTESVNLGQYGPGNYFGEIALISDLPRSATVISRGKTILLSIEKKSFRELFLSDEKVLAEFQLRVLQDKAELSHLLSHPKGLSVFRKSLVESHAEESLEFWEECNRFRKSTFSSISDLTSAAIKIYTEYCDENSPKEVNIPSVMRTALTKKIYSNEVCLEVFDDAQNEIYKLMNQDGYKRFKTSSEFKGFFEKLGIVLSK